MEAVVHGGLVGIILDGRGRPIELPKDPASRVQSLTKWLASMDAYPKGKIEELQNEFPIGADKEGGGRGYAGLFKRMRRN